MYKIMSAHQAACEWVVGEGLASEMRRRHSGRVGL